MALTGAERQRRHRLKMKAEGRPPKPKKKTAKTSAEKMMERRRKATERQRRRRQRIRTELNCSLGYQPAGVGNPEEAYTVFKAEPDMLLDSNGMVLEHRLEAGSFVFKQEPQMLLESSGEVVEDTTDGGREFEEASRGDVEVSCDDQSSVQRFEEVTSEGPEEPLAQLRLEEGRDEGCDFEVGLRAGDVISYSDGNGVRQPSLDAFIAQQRLERKRWCAAERQRKRRSKLRSEGKYHEYKLKHNVISGRNRAKQKELEKTLPDGIRDEVIAKRREDTRVRVARYRERRKVMTGEGLRNSLPMMTSSGELVHQLQSYQHQYISNDHNAPPATPVLEVQGISPHVAPLPLSVVPYALQTVECQTVTTTGSSGLNDASLHVHVQSISSRVEDKNLPTNRQEEDDIESNAPAVDFHSSRRYITPPVWPCANTYQLGQGPSQVTSVLSDCDGERQGTSQANHDTKPLGNDTHARLIQSVEDNMSYNQTQSSHVAGTDRCGSDSIHIELVTEFDQDQPYTFDHVPRALDNASMPQDLRKKLHTLQHQSPLVHNYIKKLQSDLHYLSAENQKLRKRTLCLNEIRTNDSMFQFWTGFPKYDNFNDLFELLKPSIGPITCPHPTVTPTLEEEFFYVLVRLRVGLFVKDIAARIGISDADYALMFHRWITALLHGLENIFQVCDETGQSQNQTLPKVTSSTDCTKVLVDCTGMLSEESVRKWTNPHIQLADRCKFVMGVSFATGSVVYISDVTPDNRNGQSMLVKLGHLHSTIIGLPGDQGADRGGLVQAQSDCLVKVVNHIRSFHILDNYQMKLQCETFRAIFKVCTLLSNVLK